LNGALVGENAHSTPRAGFGDAFEFVRLLGGAAMASAFGDAVCEVFLLFPLAFISRESLLVKPWLINEAP